MPEVVLAGALVMEKGVSPVGSCGGQGVRGRVSPVRTQGNYAELQSTRTSLPIRLYVMNQTSCVIPTLMGLHSLEDRSRIRRGGGRRYGCWSCSMKWGRGTVLSSECFPFFTPTSHHISQYSLIYCPA
jgi:hypothetical protein